MTTIEDSNKRGMVVVAHADHRYGQAVGAGYLPEFVVVGEAGPEGGQLHRLALADVVGDGAVDQLVEIGHPDHREHLGYVFGGRTDVAAVEGPPVAEIVKPGPGTLGVSHRYDNLPRGLNQPLPGAGYGKRSPRSVRPSFGNGPKKPCSYRP